MQVKPAEAPYSDVKKSTDSEVFGRSIEVVTPNLGPVLTSIVILSGASGKPLNPKVTFTVECLPRRRLQQQIWRAGFFVERCKAAAAATIALRRRQWRATEEPNVPVGAAVTMLQGVLLRGEKVQPPLHARVVFSGFVAVCKCLVVEQIWKLVLRMMLLASRSNGVW